MTQEIIEKPMSAECTMKQYEAIPDSDFVENREYQLTDYPDNGATNEQMTFALTCKRLFPADTVVTFSGTTDDNYTNGHLYQIQVDSSGTKSWKDITPVSEQSIPILTGTQEKPINLATDLEINKYYLITGYVYKNSTTNVQLTSKFLVQKYESTSYYVVMMYGGNFQNGTITPTASLCNSKIYLRKDNTGEWSYNIGGDKALGISKFNGYNSILIGSESILSLYAPTEAGTANQILQSNGSSKAPTWTDPATLGLATTADIEAAIGNVSALLGDTSDLEV